MPWQERNWIILREKQIEKFKQKKAREWVERQKKTKSYRTQTATQSQSDYNHNEAKFCLPKSAIFDAVVRTVNSAVSTKTNTHTHTTLKSKFITQPSFFLLLLLSLPTASQWIGIINVHLLSGKEYTLTLTKYKCFAALLTRTRYFWNFFAKTWKS